MESHFNKNTILIIAGIILFVTVTFNSYPQNQENVSIRKPDSTYRFQGIIPPIEFQYDLDEIFNKQLNNNIPEEVLFDNN